MKRGLLCMLLLLGFAIAETATADAAPARTRAVVRPNGTTQVVRVRRGRHHRHHRRVKTTQTL